MTTRKAIFILGFLILGISAQMAEVRGDKEDYGEGSLKDTAKKTMKNIKETAEGAAHKVKDLGEHIMNTAENGWEMIQEKVPSSLGEAKENLQHLVKDGIPEMVSNAGWRLQRRAKRVKEYLKGEDHGPFGGLDPDHVEHVKDSKSEAGEHLKKPGHEGGEFVDSEKKEENASLTEILEQAATELKVQANNVYEWVRGNTIGAAGETKDVIERDIENVSEWIGEHTPTIVKNTGIELQKRAKKVAAEAPNLAKQTAKSATEKLGEAASTVSEHAKAAAQVASEKLSNAAGWIKDSTPESLEDVRKKFESATEYVKAHTPEPILGIGEKFKEGASHAAEWIQENTPGSFGEAKEKLSEAAGYIKEKTPDSVLSAGESIVEGAAEAAGWIKENAPTSLDEAKETLKHAADFIKRPKPESDKKYDVYEYFTESYDEHPKKKSHTITEDLENAWEATKKQAKKARKTVRETIQKVVA